MDCSTPYFHVLHYLPEFAQIHDHWASGALQSTHPLSSPSPPVLNFSQHQGLFQWVGSSHQMAKILELHHQFLPMSSHVWMWELDYKDSWAPKNWCFWTVVLEKTLEGSLDCKVIQPVNPKGNQSWIFIGKTNAEAETPILWPPDVKNWLVCFVLF